MLLPRAIALLACLCLPMPALAGAEGRVPAPAMNDPVITEPVTISTSGTVAPPPIRPRARMDQLPAMAWDRRQGTTLWTRAALSALQGEAARLPAIVPRDIAAWCPAYPAADAAQRRAFWAGLASALARHESGHRAGAVGGGGLYHGLLQILPATAQGHGCLARSGEALQDGPANLACGLRIMSRAVARDGVIAQASGRWGGVAADWGPLRSAEKRAQMQTWLKAQSYCRPLSATRPQARPAGLGQDRLARNG
jgi:hypothetical protein